MHDGAPGGHPDFEPAIARETAVPRVGSAVRRRRRLEVPLSRRIVHPRACGHQRVVGADDADTQEPLVLRRTERERQEETEQKRLQAAPPRTGGPDSNVEIGLAESASPTPMAANVPAHGTKHY